MTVSLQLRKNVKAPPVVVEMFNFQVHSAQKNEKHNDQRKEKSVQCTASFPGETKAAADRCMQSSLVHSSDRQIRQIII